MPTICSSCGRTSGKCESCIRVDEVLTPERVYRLYDEAGAAWNNDPRRTVFLIFFARAISREVVGILAEDQARYDALLNAALNARAWFEGNPDGALGEIEHHAKALSTPAASGIGESGGRLIAGQTVVSEPGAALVVTQVHLTEAGKAALSTKRDKQSHWVVFMKPREASE